MLLSLAALSILDAGPAGLIRAAAEAGFQSAGPRLNPLLDTDIRVVGDPAREAEVERAAAETGIGILEIGVFPVRPEMNVGDLVPVLGFSARLGARFIVCPVEDDDANRRRETIARLGDAAGAHGLTPLIEFNPYSACRSLAQAVEIVENAGRGNLGLVIDALHLSRSGGHPRDLAAVDPALLRLVHFCDAAAFQPGAKSIDELRKESRGARLSPGEGELPLDALLDALPRDCPISVEAPSARHAHLPASDRARLLLAATQAFLARR